jgi:hypothetical protein
MSSSLMTRNYTRTSTASRASPFLAPLRLNGPFATNRERFYRVVRLPKPPPLPTPLGQERGDVLGQVVGQ